MVIKIKAIELKIDIVFMNSAYYYYYYWYLNYLKNKNLTVLSKCYKL